MRYEDERRALRGLLHQNLLEREFLVLGFSMTDDNVHLIIDQVRKALPPDARGEGFHMGTVVTLVENAMFRKLWANDFKVVACAESWDAVHDPAWLHDIFIDCLASRLIKRKAAASFVLDPSYAGVLDETQRKIKAALQPLRKLAHDESVKDSHVFGSIQHLLKTFGAPETLEEDDPEKDNEDHWTPRSSPA